MQTGILTYLKKNWFKVGLAAIFIFVALKKDLSFQINLNTPLKVVQPEQENSDPLEAVPDKAEKKSKAYTEKVSKGKGTKPAPATIDRFDFSPIVGASTGRKSAYDLFNEVDQAQRIAFVERFTQVAVSEQKKFGIPASITLGNALLMSQAGKQDFTVEGNNHFAIPCTSDWRGKSGNYHHGCLRHYENAWTSFRDHSLYLTTGEMARHLRGLAAEPYSTWAEALEKAGFSQEKNYAAQLTQVIRDYHLDELDE